MAAMAPVLNQLFAMSELTKALGRQLKHHHGTSDPGSQAAKNQFAIGRKEFHAY